MRCARLAAEDGGLGLLYAVMTRPASTAYAHLYFQLTDGLGRAVGDVVELTSGTGFSNVGAYGLVHGADAFAAVHEHQAGSGQQLRLQILEPSR